MLPDIQLTFVGTSSASPTLDRGLSSILLTIDGHHLLFDCGEGTSRQLVGIKETKQQSTQSLITPQLDIWGYSGDGNDLPPTEKEAVQFDYKNLAGVFLTHSHIDHWLGLFGVAWGCMQSSSQLTNDEAKVLRHIPIYGSDETLKAVMPTVKKWFHVPDYTITPWAVAPLETIDPLRYSYYADVDRAYAIGVSPFRVEHTEGSLAYLVEIVSTEMVEQPEITTAIMPNNPYRLNAAQLQQLQAGRAVELITPSGSVLINPGDDLSAYVGSEPTAEPSQNRLFRAASKRIAIMGDIAGDTLLNHAETLKSLNLDVLVTEGTYGAGSADMALKSRHSTITQAIEFSQAVQAKRTFITHITPPQSRNERNWADTALLNTGAQNIAFAYDFLSVRV